MEIQSNSPQSNEFLFLPLMIYYRCHIAVVVIIIIVKVVIVIVIIKRFFCVIRVMKKTLVASDCISVQIVFFCYFQMSLSLSSFSIPFQIEESHSKVNSSIAWRFNVQTSFRHPSSKIIILFHQKK